MPDKPIEFDLDKVRALAAKGLNNKQIASAIGCSERTIQRRLAEDEDFAAAVAQGQALLCVEVGNLLLDAARNGSVDAMKFIADRKAGWTKQTKTEVEVSAAPSLQIVFAPTPGVGN